MEFWLWNLSSQCSSQELSQQKHGCSSVKSISPLLVPSGIPLDLSGWWQVGAPSFPLLCQESRSFLLVSGAVSRFQYKECVQLTVGLLAKLRAWLVGLERSCTKSEAFPFHLGPSQSRCPVVEKYCPHQLKHVGSFLELCPFCVQVTLLCL